MSASGPSGPLFLCACCKFYEIVKSRQALIMAGNSKKIQLFYKLIEINSELMRVFYCV